MAKSKFRTTIAGVDKDGNTACIPDETKQPHWKCPDCGNTLSIEDWPYSRIASDGGPICGKKMEDDEGEYQCDRDMEFIELPTVDNSPGKLTKKTVNVIEICDFDKMNVTLHSFAEDADGNKAAEALFERLIRETAPHRLDKGNERKCLDVYLSDGFCEVASDSAILLVHST